MIIDLRPEAENLQLCNNELCKQKCKRFYKFYKPKQSQSYINPGLKYSMKDGISVLQECRYKIL